ncbi:MAG: MBOAT family protein [Lachnospiraceae bacterium]|nr:MBOAT family protein [Lachnospiraceae bacterium]
MTFNSYIFILLFLPLALLGYFGINRTGKYKYGLLWLIGVSCWFYGAFSIKFLLLFAASICINQFGVCRINEMIHGIRRKLTFWVLLVFNIGLLLYYKYCDFFIENINQIFQTEYGLLNLALPVGISFYTFRQLSYVIDCYKETSKPHAFLDYAAYALFFPMLIQGPIAGHEEVISQFQEEIRKKVSYENLSKGMYAFSRGLAKKALIADILSPIVALVFQNADAYNTTSVLLAMVCYTFQIYFDFSGYCDMAYGIGLMFNIELPINFNSPYKAVSISDFWDRWHMSLTKFFTKYVYIPLGGNRKGTVRTCVNVIIVFLVSGFWHGANWTFILWGAFHGVFKVLERFIGKWLEKIPKVIRIGVTFVLVTLAWSLFRIPTVANEKELLKQAGLMDFGALSTDIVEYFNELTEIRLLGRLGLQGVIDAYPAVLLLLFIFFLFIAVWFCKNTKEKTEEFQFDSTKKYGGKMAVTIVLLTWSIISLSEISEFIYFNF